MGQGGTSRPHVQQSGRTAVGVHYESALPITQRIHGGHQSGTGVDDGRGVDHRGHVDHPTLVDVLDEFRYVAVGGLGQDLFGGADLDDVAVAQDAHPVADPESLVQVVGDEQDRLVEFLLDGQEFVLHLTTDQRVQGTERLVHQQDVRVAAQGPGQPDALLHAPGEFPHRVERIGLQADHRECLHGFLSTFLLFHPLDLEAVTGVVDDVAVRKEGEVLEDHAHLLPPELLEGRPFQLLHVGALDDDPAVGDVVEFVDRPDGRRLAGARQAHDDEDLTLFNLEGHVGDTHHVAGLALDFVLVHTALGEFEGSPPGVGSEDLVYLFERDEGFAGLSHPPHPFRCEKARVGPPAPTDTLGFRTEEP